MKLPQISNGTSMGGIYYNADVVNLGITGYNYCNFLFHFLLLQIAKITAEGTTIHPPYSLKTYWGFSHFQNPSKGAPGTWQTKLL